MKCPFCSFSDDKVIDSREGRAGDLIRRVVGLETRVPPILSPGPEMTIQADCDQIEQLLINVIRNAVDAWLPRQGTK